MADNGTSDPHEWLEVEPVNTVASCLFKGDIRSTVTPGIYDTTSGPMFPASASYDPETDTTTLHLVKRFVR